MRQYRIVEKRLDDGEIQQGIHECYCDALGEALYITENPIVISWSMGDNTFLILEEIKQAFKQPILQYDNLIPF